MTPQEEWNKFLEKLKKDKSPLYDLYKNSQIEEGAELTLNFGSEEEKNKANAKRSQLQAKFPPGWKNKRLNLKVKLMTNAPQPAPAMAVARHQQARQEKLISPLQALNHTLLDEHTQSALEQAVTADQTCNSLYQELTQRTQQLADVTLTVQFIWRVRVGGMRGFRELLLPVFHPVYGVPYIPSSSLKGVVKAWAKQNNKLPSEINRLLGTLDNGIGCVQILDAFPTAPCLSVDMANPQWSWQGDTVRYQPVPHALLSMAEPKIAIGLKRTSRGKLEDVEIVKDWLEQALKTGIGSRVSAGYGRTSLSSGLAHASTHKFEFWTQGIYGASPPTRENRQGNPEFRPVSVRGMLRYWFRAVALGMYPPNSCRELEGRLFGTIEPSAKEGHIRLSVNWKDEPGSRNFPHFYKGEILLETKSSQELTLMEKLLQLSSHLGGIGRGARRPLHWNNPYPGLRGSYWELEGKQLAYNLTVWQSFLQEVKDAFIAVQPLNGNPAPCSPGNPGKRCQDVLNNQSQIYLIPCPDLLHPEEVDNWRTQGTTPEVRGEALDLLYDNRFKGVNQQGIGNANVGGRISETGSTPSYVAIKSNFPSQAPAYQAVTIFGANQRDRSNFAKELCSLTHLHIM